jgi:hypothetical protein
LRPILAQLVADRISELRLVHARLSNAVSEGTHVHGEPTV